MTSPVLSMMGDAVSNCGNYVTYGTNFVAGATTTISETDIVVNSNPGAGSAASPVVIAFYNGSSGTAGTLIGTETQTASSITDSNHSGTYSIIQLMGSIPLVANQSYSWEYTSNPNSLSFCYAFTGVQIAYNNYGVSTWSVGKYVYANQIGGSYAAFIFALGGNLTSQSISVTSSASALSNGQSATLSPVGYSGTGAITYSDSNGKCTFSGNTVTANSGSGSCSVTATIAADSTYASATSSAITINLSLGITTVTISVTPGAYNFQYGKTISITATVTGTNGTVTFTYRGKNIFHCVNLPTTGLTATCNWKISAHGPVLIGALFTPTSGYASSIATQTMVNATSRTAIHG
jgi:hypothetical protein